MDLRNELEEYRAIFENELHNNILDYWIKYGVEEDGLGFYGAVDLNNQAVLSSNTRHSKDD